MRGCQTTQMLSSFAPLSLCLSFFLLYCVFLSLSSHLPFKCVV